MCENGEVCVAEERECVREASRGSIPVQIRSRYYLLTLSGMPSTCFPRLAGSWLFILLHTTHIITSVQLIDVLCLSLQDSVSSPLDQTRCKTSGAVQC